MNSSPIKEIDAEGHEILNVIEKADLFNQWMYDTIAPYCHGRILEIGSGIGNISHFFIKNGSDIVLSDLRDNYCDILKSKFPNNDAVKMDLVDTEFDHLYSGLIGTFDTVFALNVVEHIEDDRLAIANCKKLLKKGGTLIILVPAYQFLYNRFDSELEHFRRYDRKSLAEIIKGNGFEIKRLFNFNLIGIAGWFVSGKIQKNKSIPEGQMSLFNKLVPIFKLADQVVGNRMGLSVICVAKKQTGF